MFFALRLAYHEEQENTDYNQKERVCEYSKEDYRAGYDYVGFVF
jgi:hypothetical protein